MFKINKKIEYALIALKHIGQKPSGTLTSVKEICDLYKSPFDVMSRAMQKMVRKGILNSEKGVNGGYSLQRDLSNINLLQLVEVILGEVHVANCLDADKCDCALTATCNVISPILNLDQRLRQFLAQLTVAELIESDFAEEQQVRQDFNTHMELR